MVTLSLRNLLFIALSLGLAFSVQAESTAVDSLLQGKEYKLPPLDSSYRTKTSGFKTSSGNAAQDREVGFAVQFDAIADFDAAQARRSDLQRRTGMSIQLVFDSPFYKLRAGNYSKKEDAEDQARQLSELNIQAFVVKFSKK
jgi:hypothetical protein